MGTAWACLLLLSGALQPLCAQKVTTDQWHTVSGGCADGGTVQIRPVAVLDETKAVGAWQVELRIPEDSGCSLPRPRRLRLVIDGTRVSSAFEPVEGKAAAQVTLSEATARALAEAEEVRIVENAIQVDVPRVFQADTRRIMKKASSIAQQSEEKEGKEKKTKRADPPSESKKSSSENESDEVFLTVDEQPRLIGGRDQIQKVLQYPDAAKQKEIEGRVFVEFVVNERGRAQNPEVTRGVHELLNKEALRVVRKLKFTPGKQRGRPVKVRMTLPITFMLPQGD